MSEAILELVGVYKAFGGVRALVDLSFRLKEGIITAMIGPNGAGKTTTFNVISGLLRPDAGALFYRGQPLHHLPPYRIARLGIGRLFQDVKLFSGLSTLDNVVVARPRQRTENPLVALAAPILIGRERRAQEARALEILEFVGLADLARRPAWALSYGQQKRLALARLLAAEARLLLLDEPTAGVDPRAMADLMTLLRRLAASGHTLFVIEHNRDVVRDLADYVLFLDRGRILREGSPAIILDDRELAERYLGV